MSAHDVEVETGVSYDDVSRCQSDAEGENILQRMGVRTKSVLSKDFYWVPWVTINQVSRRTWKEMRTYSSYVLCSLFPQDFKRADFEEMQYNLFEFMCQNYLSDKPECQ